jgi:hypothetical protein
MAKVKVIKPFVGQPDEMAQFAGQIPSDFKKSEKKMSDEEKGSFKNIITRGTVMEVNDKRARELAAAGVVESKTEKEEPKTAEKNKNAGPGK